MPTGYFAPAAGLLSKMVSHYGQDPDRLFKELDLDPACIADPDTRLDCETVERLWAKAAEASNDPCFGLTAPDYLHPSHLGALGYGWLASHSLRTALQRVQRFLKLLTEQREILVKDQGTRVSIETWLEPSARTLPERADVAMTVLMTMFRWNHGPDLKPLTVSFVHGRPQADCAERFDAFFRCRVTYGAKANAIVLATSDVDRPLPSGNPQLAKINDQYLADYLHRLDHTDVMSRAKRAITERLSAGEPRISEIAACLHLSVRTLQRRLKELGTSFADVVDQTRRELTEVHLRDPRTTMTEIAFNTGFATQSGFTTAVKRWTDRTPSEYRRQLIGA